MREANLCLEVTALEKREAHKKAHTGLLNGILRLYLKEPKGLVKTYFIEGVLGPFEGHIPQEQIIVIFEANARS